MRTVQTEVDSWVVERVRCPLFGPWAEAGGRFLQDVLLRAG